MVSSRKLKIGYLMGDPWIDLTAYQGCRVHVDKIVVGLRDAGMK
jgi:hypothetical protein